MNTCAKVMAARGVSWHADVFITQWVARGEEKEKKKEKKRKRKKWILVGHYQSVQLKPHIQMQQQPRAVTHGAFEARKRKHYS